MKQRVSNNWPVSLGFAVFKNPKLFDLVGERFGKLIVTHRYDGIPTDQKTKAVYWVCSCECGGTRVARSRALRSEGIDSCGCTGRGRGIRIKEPDTRDNLVKDYQCVAGKILRRYWYSLNSSARKRNLIFTITPEYAWKLFLSQDEGCAYTEYKLAFADGKRILETTASLDRIDNTKGYIEGNVQWVHKIVNIMKRDLTHTHFIQICKRIAA